MLSKWVQSKRSDITENHSGWLQRKDLNVPMFSNDRKPIRL